MKLAGTRKSHDHQIRKHSYLTWIKHQQQNIHDDDDTYLNVIGGTYFQSANPINHSLERVMTAVKSKIPGQDGLRVVGKQGLDWYLNNKWTDLSSHHESTNIEYVQPGDAIVFYTHKFDGNDDDNNRPTSAGGDNMEIGMREWKLIHSGLEIPEEKWIATN
jgi:hypothetical protein